jgi:hypothetical protein
VAAKASQNPTVSAANPSFGDQGVTLDVQVTGTGFTDGAAASWLLNGAPDGRIRTNHTTFVSSTQLSANITIDPTATLAYRDIQVALIGGKNGVGSDAFEVTSAQLLSTQNVTAVLGANELLDVAGYFSGGSEAFVYDDASGFVDLGSGQAWAADPQAQLALGSNGSGGAAAWTRQPSGAWTLQLLPAAPNSAGRMVRAAARTPGNVLLAAGMDATPPTSHNGSPYNRPVVWQLANGVWSAPTIYAYPPGVVRASARGINGLGQIVGEVNGSPQGAVWDTPTTGLLLDGQPMSINAAGTLIVGQKTGGGSSGPAYWWRDPATSAWHTTSTLLPSIAGAKCTSGTARAMNDAGVVVGDSCNSAGKLQATVWHIDLSGSMPVVVGTATALSGLGAKLTSASPISNAASVSNGTPAVASGFALLNGQQLLVRWVVP